ncbi:MAG TPA: 50S ribosomal protein L25 [Polyangiaceae bacterium]|jgi:large subunit ribosomal protein L25|nr:50S ribosomal protein L25 [Polyangiaceae bacterium]
MDIIKLDANLRSQSGKTSARRLRREGRIPAIAYGKELPSVSLAVTPRGLTDILKSAHGQNTVVELSVEQKKLTVLLREYTIHPLTREPLHADFVEIKLDKPVDVEVPFVCKGKAAGVVLGGILRQVYRRLPIRCLPEQIPVVIEHDVTALNLGDHVKTADLALPQGVTVRLPADQTVAGVVAPEKEKPEDVEAAAAVPGAAPGASQAPGATAAATAAGATAAPAAGAAAGKDDKKAAPAGKDKKK